MPITKNQSAISDVRDEMSLDYAQGKYLNNVSANLGLMRPKLGFNDDTWRAIVKVVAVQAKQVKDKFADVLAVLFGPRFTLGITLARDASAGQKVIYVNDITDLPQLGTMIIDEGLATQEIVSYTMVDKQTKAVYLQNPLSFAHSAVARDFSAYLTVPANTLNLELFVNDASTFPTTYLPALMVLDPGMSNEEVVQVVSVDVSRNALALLAPPTKNHAAVTPTAVETTASASYIENSEIIALTNSKKFPPSGSGVIGPSTPFTASAGDPTSVVVATPSFTANKQIGSIVVFTGNITAALEGFSATVMDNDTTTLYTLETLPATPAAGDTFVINSVFYYTRNSYEDNTLVLRDALYDCQYSAGTQVFANEINTTVKLSQIKVSRGSWDIFQTGKHTVDILLADRLNERFDPRSASYLHHGGGLLSTTFSTNVPVGASVLPVTSTVPFETFVGAHLTNGTNSEFVGAAKIEISNTINLGSSTKTTITLIDPLPTAGSLVGAQLLIGTKKYMKEVNNNTATTITLVDPLTDYEYAEMVANPIAVYYDPFNFNIVNSKVTVHSYLAGDFLYSMNGITYSEGPIVKGSIWSQKALGYPAFPGPYLYDISQPSIRAISPYNRIQKTLPGPSRLQMSVDINGTAIEVQDARYFEDTDFPYQAVLGDGTSQREEVQVLGLSFRNKTKTTLLSNTAIGSTDIPCTGFTGVGSNDDFPNATGYRIVIDEGNAQEEVLYVVRLNVPGTSFVIYPPAQKTHTAGAVIRLKSDTFFVDTLTKRHIGLVSLSERNYPHPTTTSTDFENSEHFIALLSKINLTTTASFPTSGKIVLNKGNGYLERSTTVAVLDSNTGSVQVADATIFPAAPFKVVIGKGRANEEVLWVTSILGSTLNYEQDALYSHGVGELVVIEAGIEEVIEYSNIISNTLRFSPPLMLQSLHQVDENVLLTLSASVPKTDGYDFPLRMPPSIEFRIRYIIDLIRAAGVKVNVVIIPEEELLSLRR